MSDRGPALSSLWAVSDAVGPKTNRGTQPSGALLHFLTRKKKKPSRRCARFPGKCILELSGEEEEGETSFLLCFHF